ncbi:MAG: CotH kinase family protein [Melioribacteraceae bacterium]|nr:CotH kinase family protein [Melioribacteraceae bacterium]
MKRILIMVLLFTFSLLKAQSIVINEVMSSNKKTIYDENGDASDWFELYNISENEINLNGFYVTDDSLKIKKWMFGNRVIKPKSYLIVFASSKDRKDKYDHTNFNISAAGEILILSDPQGKVVDKIFVPASQSDISYGREYDGSIKWTFQNPSPGKPNNGKLNNNISDSVKVSLKGGFYSSQISLSLQSANDCKIYYTLDGKDPDSTSNLYSAPINISKTTVLKAVSIKKDFLPSPVLIQTYLINEKTDLPVISLITDPYNLFDKNYGIYTNYTMDWERPAYIEFYDENKKLGFTKNCIINIHGSQSANWAQKSLAVKFKDGIPPLEYPLFPDFRIKTFKSFVLRNSGNDWQYTHIRDAMMQTLVKDLDIEYQEYRPAVTFINGEYWGIYNIREKINEHYISYRHNVNPDSIDMLENNMSVLYGDSLHYLKLINYITNADMNSEESYNFIKNMIDLDECILYFAAQAYYDNMDWPGTNIKYWRERKSTGKWRWILFDLDFGFGLYNHGPWEDHIAFMFSPVETRYSNPPWSTLLQRKLVANSKIRNKFINQIADLLNTNFKSDRVVNIINTLSNRIATELVRHRKRWNLVGESTSKLISFANERPAYLRNHVRNYFNCGNNGQITLNASKGGKIKINTLTIEKEKMPWQGIYFDNNKIFLQAIPEPGFKFDGWSGDISSNSDTVSLYVSRTKNIYANFSESNVNFSDIIINEINYNSSSQFDPGDWIEIFNRGSKAIDISNWIFSDSDPNHNFIIPNGTILEPNNYLVIAENINLFTSKFPNVKNFVGPTNFGLSGSGEFIKISDKNKNIIDSLTYDDDLPWPKEPDGQGATLELKDPFSDNSKGENWKASIGFGSPGTKNSIVSSVENFSNQLPDEFILYQNYPNPFGNLINSNSSTTIIRYSIPAESQTFSAVDNRITSTTNNQSDNLVTLKVYDALGNLISTLVNEPQKAGYYEVKFNGNNLSSGVYFYRLQKGNFIQTKKFILMK